MEQEKLGCSICLDLLKDPVTIPCGHSYCMDCIRSYWDRQYLGQIYSCPQCRQTFRPRPDLKKNTVLADLVEEVKKTISKAASTDLCYAGPGDVSCDFCTGRKLKAVKSCLQCLVSYCEQHLQPHYHVAAFEKHKLVNPSKKLQESICSRHNEVMKIFCRTDQQCICYLCLLEEHKGHDTVLAEAERNDKQRVVKLNQEKIQQRIREKEEGVKLLQQEISELRRRSSELELLSQTDDHIQFLQSYTLLGRLSESVSDATDKPQDVLRKRSTESSWISYQSFALKKPQLVNPSKKLHEHPDKFTIAVLGKNPDFNKTIQHQILSNDITSDKTLNGIVVLENNSFRTISAHDFFDEECLYQDQQMINFMAQCSSGVNLFILAIDSENTQEVNAVSQIIKLQDIFGENVTQHLVVVLKNYSSYKSLSQLKEIFHIELGTLSEHLADDCKKWCSSRPVFKYNYRNYVEELQKRRKNDLERKRNKDRDERSVERKSSMSLREDFLAFNIVLLGRTGTGKSASGNTILTAVNSKLDPSQLFKSRPSATPVTSKCEFKEINVFSRLVRVVDTPDFFNDEIDSQTQVEECKKYCQPGCCVVLLVIQMGRFIDGERGILERLENKLGWRIRESTIVLLTHGENAKGQEQSFIAEWTDLDSMVRACGNRLHVFKNTYKNHKQVMELFKKIPDFEVIFPEFTEKPLCCMS